jgi:hypothetical protein
MPWAFGARRFRARGQQQTGSGKRQLMSLTAAKPLQKMIEYRTNVRYPNFFVAYTVSRFA